MIKLDYFKESGKYYSSAEIDPNEMNFYAFVNHIKQLSEDKQLPGLVKNHSSYYVHFTYKDVPQIVVPNFNK